MKGWQGESHRHYLASKGIKTANTANKVNKYYADKIDYAAVASGIQSFFSDGKPQTENYEVSVKNRRIQSLLGEVYSEIGKEERAGNISSENADRFVTEDFRTEEKDYRDNTIDYDHFRSNVLRKLNKHKEMHTTKLRCFEWAEADGGVKDGKN